MNEATSRANAAARQADPPPEPSAAAGRIAVLIPCLDEETTIAKVVTDFHRALPDAAVYVYDNNSTDRTAERARDAGAVVVPSPWPGKGNVIRHMLATVRADVYVMVDGDDTYSAEAAPELVRRLVESDLDMVVATRIADHSGGAFRRFHRLGNELISKILSALFSTSVADVLSGYRVLSQRFVRVISLNSDGFEVETELTLQALARKCRVREVSVPYRERPRDSHSKLRTWGDGYVILKCLFLLFKDYRPFEFFATVTVLLAALSFLCGLGPIIEFAHTGAVVRLIPQAVLAAGLGIVAAISFVAGLILDTIARYHRETMDILKRHMPE